MTREYIEVTGARENNLRDVSVRVPKRAITAFVGVSGSGKSSLVFDTIAGEARASSTRRSPRSSAGSCRSSASLTPTSSRTCPRRSSSTSAGSAAGRARRWAPSPTSTPCCGCCGRAAAGR